MYKAKRWATVALKETPKAKGVRRYRSLARISKMAHELKHRATPRESEPRKRINPIAPVGTVGTVTHGSTVIGIPIYGPEPGLVTVIASTDDGQHRPANRPQPGDT